MKNNTFDTLNTQQYKRYETIHNDTNRYKRENQLFCICFKQLCEKQAKSCIAKSGSLF